MTQARWIFIILCFLLPAATDLLFHICVLADWMYSYCNDLEFLLWVRNP